MMENISLFLKALHFAADKHRGQRRKDESASPYINHPIYVAQILSGIAGIDDVEVLCGAILHDTVEDTETSLNDIELAFGLRVARIVEEVTDDKSLAKDARKQAQIDHATHISREGALVKVADKIANIRDVASNPPSDWSTKRRKEYLDWAEEVVTNCKPESPDLLSYFEDSLGSARKGIDS